LRGLKGSAASLYSALTEGFLAPLRAALSPGRFYSWLSRALDRYGLYFAAAFYLAAWTGAAAFSFTLSLAVLILRGLAGLDPASIAAAPFKALALAVATPFTAALVDAVLIALVAAFSPRRRPLYAVFLVRASSLLPYTLRAPLVAALGGGPVNLVASPLHPLDLALLAVGALLTAYGLRRSMGMPAPHSLAAASLPALLKAGLGALLLEG